ncbi:cadherin-23-like [Macrobrachium nipponense]|uniref:cadherin-23-like n=1 Tax=Macrobrachium nipponense TaxID=159736 RepID=UPI0030C85DAC
MLIPRTEKQYSVVDCSNQLEVNDVSGIVTIAQDGALDYEEETRLLCKIRARDGEGVDSHTSECTVNITVTDVNDSPPTLTFEFQNITVPENTPSGTVLDVRINASDPDTTASLTFDIEWAKSTAHKGAEEVSIEKVKKWFVVKKIADGEAAEAALVVGDKAPDREDADTLRLSIKVTDEKTDQGYLDKASQFLEIQILDENDTPPEFVGDYSDLKVLENSEEGTLIVVVEASDADEKDAVTLSMLPCATTTGGWTDGKNRTRHFIVIISFFCTFSDDTYISITQTDDFRAELVVSGKTLIDREKMETIQVILTIEDRNSHLKDQTFTVAVLDENDNGPTFLEDIIFASFTPYDKIGNSLKLISAKDVDQNEDLNFQLENDFEWPDGGLDPAPPVPFRVQNKEGNDAELLLNFDPLGVSNGYCNFTITCLDNDGKHNASVKGKVYAITSDFEVAVNYDNPSSVIRGLSMPIQSVFGEVYGFPSIIDSIADGEDDTKSVVKMHFIDEEKNEPVEASRIIEMSNEYAISQALISKNEDLGLNIVSVGNVTPDQGGGGVNNVLILEVGPSLEKVNKVSCHLR